MSKGQCLAQMSEQCSSSTQQSPCDVWCGHRLLNIQTSHVLHLLKASIKHIRQMKLDNEVSLRPDFSIKVISINDIK